MEQKWSPVHLKWRAVELKWSPGEAQMEPGGAKNEANPRAKSETNMRTTWKENETKRVVKTRQKHRHNNANKQARTIDKNMADQAKIIETPAKNKQHHRPTHEKKNPTP